MCREMKDSGIPWIGEIPSHWRTERIKTIFSERTELSEDGTEDLLSVSEYYGVDKRAGRVEEGEFVSRSESLVGYKKCYRGDLVSNIMLAWKGSLGVSDYDGVVSPAYCVYKPIDEIFPKYYHYLFRTSLYTGRFRCFSKGIIDSRLRLYSPYFFDIEAIVPPKEEQISIADFLDRKCGEIDEMVSLQEKIVEELKAYKQSVITEAVCKGLNPNVPVKDSGIEWIGQIPIGWDCCQLKYKIQLINGRAYADNEFLENGKYRVLRVGNLFTNGKWYYSDMELEPDKYCKNGDLLYAWSASFGPHIWNEEKVIYHYHIWKANLKGIEKKYAYYMLAALTFFKRSDAHGTAMVHITMENMNKSYIPLPPKEVQQSIADYLDKKSGEIDALISVKQSKIEALREYKKSIIYEYITGKKDING